MYTHTSYIQKHIQINHTAQYLHWHKTKSSVKTLQGVPKMDPLEKNRYLWNYTKFLHTETHSNILY